MTRRTRIDFRKGCAFIIITPFAGTLTSKMLKPQRTQSSQGNPKDRPNNCYLERSQHNGVLCDLCVLCGSRSSVSPSQCVQVSSDVAAVLLSYAHLRHHSVRFNLARVLNPAHQILRRVGQLTRDELAIADAVQRRPNQAMRARHSVDGVTRIAAVLSN